MDKIIKTEVEWKNLLSEKEFEICRKKGTERAFSGEYNNCKEAGVYACVCCGDHLFESSAKFESGSGWPSFFEPINSKSINETADYSFSMNRIEVACARCDSHLGHVFPDGPQPTGLRYCLNSVALNLIRKAALKEHKKM